MSFRRLRELREDRDLKIYLFFEINQIARGIREILKYVHEEIKKWQEVEVRSKYKQLELKL